MFRPLRSVGGAVLLLVALLGQPTPSASAATATISTVAGTGVRGYSGDGGAATAAQLGAAGQMATDSNGNLYIPDTDQQVVRKVTSGGIISTVAGTGVSGYSGDSGPATAAQLSRPSGLAVNGLGELYIADTFNMVVRKVTSGGIISTVAGTGAFGYSGDGGPATAAELESPNSIAFDLTGNLYIADNTVVRKVTVGGTISTVAGTGAYGYSGDGGPATAAVMGYIGGGLVVNAAGELYIGDSDNAVVRKVTVGGTISTVAGTGAYGYSGDGGPATAAAMQYVGGLVINAAGELYIGDANVVRKVTPGGIISTVAGTGVSGYSGDGGPASSAQLGVVIGLAISTPGDLYIADYSASVVRKVDFSSVAVQMTATVAPLFSFSVSGYNAGACNGAAVTAASSTPTAIRLNPKPSANDVAGQVLLVGTNANNGYTVYARLSGALTSGAGQSIPEWTGTSATPTAFPSAGTASFGYTTDGLTAFASNAWAGFTTGNAMVASVNGPVLSSLTHICLQAGIDGSTPAGTYSTNLTYTAVPSF